MELRQRRGNDAPEEEEGDDSRFIFKLPTSQTGFPTVDEVLQDHPDCKHGFLEKHNNSLMMQLMPCCGRKWKPRYFCLIGGYLYRFSEYPGGTIKGVPIPLEACSIRALTEGDITLDPGDVLGACFEMSMIRKSYIFKASSVAEAEEWLAALRTRKLQSIKEGLGHAPVSPAVRALNAKAAKKFSQRIDQDRTEGEARLKEFNKQSAALNPMMGGGMGMSSGR